MIEPTDEMRMVAYRDAREWAAAHRHQQPDDRMIDEVLAAVLAIVEREYDVRCGVLNDRYFGEVRCDEQPGHDGEHRNIEGDTVVFW